MKCVLSIIIVTTLVFAGCVKKAEGPAGPQGAQGPPGNGASHFVGEKFGGGIVYYVNRDAAGNEHGLIVSPKDIGKFSWGLSNDVPNCESMWDGKKNTASIVADGTDSQRAAAACVSYRGGGKDDWFLPAVDQLQMLVAASYELNKVFDTDDDPETQVMHLSDPLSQGYWASTERSDMFGWIMRYDLGSSLKSSVFAVRAVREF